MAAARKQIEVMHHVTFARRIFHLSLASPDILTETFNISKVRAMDDSPDDHFDRLVLPGS